MRTSTYFLLTILLGFSTNLVAAEFEDCLEILSHIERLECYDRIARDVKKRQSKKSQVEIDQAKPLGPAMSLATEPIEKPLTAGQVESVTKIDKSPIGFFGKREKPKKLQQQVRARIESIRKSPLGNQIMTLSNGQVWAENEPGRLIQTQQTVTITQKRFNFEMKLESGTRVAVRRID